MRELTGYTRHGHAITGVPQLGEKPQFVARCGGAALCGQCGTEAAFALQSFRYHPESWSGANPEPKPALPLPELDGNRWYDHPGRISTVKWQGHEENVCQVHEREILAALKVVGLGCTGTPNRLTLKCDRCE